MSTKRIRSAFIFFLVFLPLQYIIVGIVGYYQDEPWPAFVLPGFKNIYVYNGLFEIHQIYFELYDSDSKNTGRFKPYQFFPDKPRSQISGFMRSHFQKAHSIEGLSDEARKWLKENLGRITDEEVTRIGVVYDVEYYRRYGAGLRIDSVDHQFTAMIHLDDL